MAKPLSIQIAESVPELKALQKKHPTKVKQLQMLLLLKKHGPLSQLVLAERLGVSDKSVSQWRKAYKEQGIQYLLQEKRGGYKPAALSGKPQAALSKRLNNAQEGFRSFVEVQQWLFTEFGIKMGYQAVNKYIKRKFGAKLKVSRKSHVQKDPAAEAVFKKPFRKIKVTSSKI